MATYSFSAAETFTILFAIILVRYFAISAAFYFGTTVWLKRRWKKRRLHLHAITRKQIASEIGWSVVSCFIFAAAGTLGWMAWAHGHTQVYLSVSDHGWLYLVASLPLLLFLHDTYFYFTHRLMHHPRLFRAIHKTHHNSGNPSPFASLSFHPLESVVEALILPLLVIAVPTHPAILLTVLTIMTIFGVVNHTGYEVYSSAFVNNRLLRQWLTTTHHELHHRHYRTNYGLYFTFWDRWLKTEHPHYEAMFYEITNRIQQTDSVVKDLTEELPAGIGAIFHTAPGKSESY